MKMRINRIGDIGSGTHATAVTDATGKYGYDNQFFVYTPGNGSPPGIPDMFYGTIYINGSPAPAGTSITADMMNNLISFSINGVSTGQTMQYEWGGQNKKDFYVTGSTPPPTGSFVAGTTRNFSMALHNPASVAVTYTNLQLWLKRSDSVSVPDGWSTSLDQLVLSAGGNGTFSGSIRLPDNAGPYESRLRGQKIANGVTTNIEIAVGQTVTVTAAAPPPSGGQITINSAEYVPTHITFDFTNTFTQPYTLSEQRIVLDGVTYNQGSSPAMPTNVTAFVYTCGAGQGLPALSAGQHTVSLTLFVGGQQVSNVFTGTVTVAGTTPPPGTMIVISSMAYHPDTSGSTGGNIHVTIVDNYTVPITLTMHFIIDGVDHYFEKYFGVGQMGLDVWLSKPPNYQDMLLPAGTHAVSVTIMHADGQVVSNTLTGTIIN